VINTLEAQLGHFLQVPGEPGIFVQEQDSLGEFLLRFSFKMSFNCNSRDQ
jgi:hypothetical protein